MATQVIIKPGGIALTVIGVLALAGLAVPKWQKRGNEGSTQSTSATKTAPVLSEDQFWSSSSIKDEKAHTVEIDPTLPSGSNKLIHVFSKPKHNEDWQLQTGVGIPVEVKSGDQAQVKFWARTDNPSAKIQFSVEFNSDPYEKLLLKPVTLTNQWTEYTVPVNFAKAVPPGKGNITFQCGKAGSDCYFSAVRFSLL